MNAFTGKAFHVSPLGNETVKQAPISCNTPCNSDETVSLKDLAHKILLRNSQCNKHETKVFCDETRTETASQPAFDREAFDERAAIIDANGAPREWAEGFATLCTMPRPLVYAPHRWEQIINDGGLFLDRWGRQAAALGWQATDVFGVNPDAPESRYDGMGLVPLLEGRPVIAVTDGTARIDYGNGVQTTFYRKARDNGSGALWELVKI